jgi:potassium efflux system protein
MLFVTTSISEQPDDAWRGALGRWSLVLPLLGLASFLRKLVGGKHSAFAGSGPWERMGRPMRFVISLTLIGLPIALSVLALLGYTFTADVLYDRLLETLLLLFLVVVGRAFVLRMLLLANRQVIVKQTRERLRAAQAAVAGTETQTDQLKIEAGALDLVAVTQAARQLTRAAVYVVLAIGAWSIWVDFLPAIRVLDTVELWHETVQVTETVKDATGAASTRTVERLEPVTLANLLGAFALTILTWIAARNVPAFLEIAVLQRTGLRAGERYAVTSLARYVIVLVGGVAAFSVLGIGWSQIQWLIAGVSVGLGFGLQEIFANFVSGVILLFERPIRVGDTVTVGDTDGIVTRIQMRATTVRDWNRHELVIPNKDFVTQRVVNWSLSDTIVRLVVKVGVAYGSNPEQVRELLEKSARSVPVIVDDPAPTAVFRNFGDNSLEFMLRAFIASMDDWLAGMNGLHDAVARELAAAGIEISFPQRDLHLRSVGPLREILAGVRSDADEPVG